MIKGKILEADVQIKGRVISGKPSWNHQILFKGSSDPSHFIFEINVEKDGSEMQRL